MLVDPAVDKVYSMWVTDGEARVIADALAAAGENGDLANRFARIARPA